MWVGWVCGLLGRFCNIVLDFGWFFVCVVCCGLDLGMSLDCFVFCFVGLGLVV